jgi:hypothetical protein
MITSNSPYSISILPKTKLEEIYKDLKANKRRIGVNRGIEYF